MSTSDTAKEQRTLRRAALAWLLAAAFVAVFSRVYQVFSHDVWSASMVFAFMYPLLGGALPLTVCALCSVRVIPGRLCRWLLSAGLAALTVGSVLSGVLEIYGTANRLLAVYRFVGWPLVVLAVLLYLLGCFAPKKRRTSRHGAANGGE